MKKFNMNEHKKRTNGLKIRWPFSCAYCAQSVPVKIKKFQTVPNETKNNISITY